MSKTLPVFQDSAICTPCGGHCCKTIPGMTMPEDWGAPDMTTVTGRLKEAFASGRYSLNWWEGESWREQPELHGKVFIVAPAVEDGEGDTEYPDNVGGGWFAPPVRLGCTFLKSDGCELGFDSRPHGCRTLEPSIMGNCKPHGGGMAEFALAWAPYQEAIAMARANT